MNQSKLVVKVADRTGLPRSQAEAAVKAAFQAIVEAASSGEETRLPGFGVFKVKERAARTARNPQTGASIDIPASRALSFQPGKAVKEALNG